MRSCLALPCLTVRLCNSRLSTTPKPKTRRGGQRKNPNISPPLTVAVPRAKSKKIGPSTNHSGSGWRLWKSREGTWRLPRGARMMCREGGVASPLSKRHCVTIPSAGQLTGDNERMKNQSASCHLRETVYCGPALHAQTAPPAMLPPIPLYLKQKGGK